MKKTFDFRKALVLAMIVVMCVAVFAACNEKEYDMTSLNTAKSFLNNKYKDASTETPADYELIANVPVKGGSYPIEWTVTVTSGDPEGVKVVTEDGKVTIDVPDRAASDINYVLKATIKDGDHSVSIEFTRVVPKWRELTWAEYVAAADDKAIVVKGYVTAFSSKKNGASTNTIYMQDADGGYYVYQLEADPVDLEIEKGMLIRVTGTKDTYSGTYEVTNPTVEILEGKTVQTPADYTGIFKSAATLKDKNLVAKQGFLVTIKGVTLGSQDTSNGYYRFKLGELTSYIRLSSSVCPLTKDEQTAFKKLHTEKKGWTADVTGVICVFDGAFYLTPAGADAISNLQLPVLDDKGAVAAEKDILSFASAFTEDAEVTLAAKGTNYTDQVSIAWAFKEGTTPKNAKIENGKLIVTLGEEEETVTIVATLTAGTGEAKFTETKEFTFTIDAASTAVYVPTVVTSMKAGTYKFIMDTTAAGGKVLYFSGTLNNKGALETTDKANKAADVVVEAVAGKTNVYTLKVGDKYLVGYLNGTYNNIKLDATAGEWTWNETIKAFTCTFNDKNGTETTFYFGTYAKNGAAGDTMALSAISYISGDNASKIGVSQFVGQVCTLAEGKYKAEVASTMKAGTYKFVMDTTAAGGKLLFFKGTLNNKGALETTDKADKAADVIIEAVAGKTNVYTLKVGDKYLVGYLNGTYNNIKLDATAGEWTWNETIKAFTCTFNDKNGTETTFYFGTYAKNGAAGDTMALSAISYISGDNASKIGVSQFVGQVYIVK